MCKELSIENYFEKKDTNRFIYENFPFFRIITNFSKFFKPIFMLAFLFSLATICSTMLMAQRAMVQCYSLNENHRFFLCKSKHDRQIFNICLPFFFQINHEISSFTLVILFAAAFYAFGFVFILCELCERISQGFNEINNIFNEYNYLTVPMEIRRLICTQQPMEFKFFGSIACSRESFKKVSSADLFV